jgi:large subunit ribosomal protein L7/L12
MAAEGRKFGIALHLANQSLAQMNADRRDTLLGSISTVLTFRLGPTDAEFISPYVGPRFSSRDLLEIPNYWAIARLSTRAGVTHPFAFQAADPVPPRDDQRVERIRRICQERQAAVYAAGKPISTACVAQSEVDETSDEKTEFNVVLARVGAHKLIVIRIIREVSGLGLEAAAKLAANAPTAIKEGVSRLEAKNIEERFAKAGAIVEIRLADSQRN